jgi:glycosyltransferase involved in cell wall biosynthesis
MDFSRYDWLFRASYALECRLARSADLIIANSEAGRRMHVADGYPCQTTIVIPNGIDTSRFSPNPEAREQIRAQWGVGEGEALIGLVGRLDPQKDHETFFQAAAMLLQERSHVRFVCVGDGPSEYRAALRKLAGKLGLDGHIVWAGARADVHNSYSALDLLVSSSSFGEGFPNVIGEAMACGLPCVATDVGDSALVIGGLGEVVKPKDPVALKEGIKRVLGSKPHAAEIRGRIVERFSLDSLVLASEQALLAVCKKTAGTVVPTRDGAPLY